jgi:hypothetical protein
MKNFSTLLFAFVFLFLAFQSCKKDLDKITEADIATVDYPFSISTNSMHGSFEQISNPSGVYLSGTNIIDWETELAGDVLTSITDGVLALNFSHGLLYIDPGPDNYNATPWGNTGQVEADNPHSLYNDPENFPLVFTLSQPVKTLGFEVFWNGANDFEVEFWGGNNKLGSVTRSFAYDEDVFGSALLFAASVNNNSIDKVIFKPGVDIGFGFAIAQVRYTIAPPPPPVQKIVFDVQPGSCENNFNTRSQGVTPMVIYGSSNLSVSDINLSTIRINGIAPLRTSFERVGAPYTKVNDCDCSATGSDNIMDLALKFDTQALVPSLAGVADNARTTLVITGKLNDGTDLEGRDCIRVKRK